MQRSDRSRSIGPTTTGDHSDTRRIARAVLLCAVVVLGIAVPAVGVAGAQSADASTPDRLEPNDSREEATSVSDGEQFEDLSIESGDEDFFAIQLDAGQTIDVQIFFSHGEADLDMEVQDASGNELEDSVSVSDDERIQYTAQESGTYYVQVYPFSGTADYDLQIDVDEGEVSTPTPSGDLSADQLEPNDEHASATGVAPGDSFDGLTITGNDEDVFAIQLNAGETVTAEMFFSDADADLDMQLEDAGGSELASSTSVTDNEQIQYTVQESGTYYVRVYPWSGTADYDFQIDTSQGEVDSTATPVPDDDPVSPDSLEPNNERSSAVPVSHGTTHEGLTVTEGDQDVFSIQLDEGQTITAEMLFSHADADLDIRLEDIDGDELASSVSTSDNEQLEYTAESAGTYYLVVYPFSGTATYDLSVMLDPVSTETPTPTETPEEEEEEDNDGSSGNISFSFGPGFGPVAALVALLVAALFVRRRS